MIWGHSVIDPETSEGKYNGLSWSAYHILLAILIVLDPKQVLPLFPIIVLEPEINTLPVIVFVPIKVFEPVILKLPVINADPVNGNGET